MTGPFIVTASGLLFPLLKPEVQHVRLRDISRHLAKINRFNGATRECYSVAQHSLHVCELLALRKGSPLLQLHGLLHDAAEAYVNDMTRPMREALNFYGNRSIFTDIEADIQFIILQAFDLGEIDPNDILRIIRADDDMLASEFRDLMPESDFKPQGCPASFQIKPMRWDVAEEKFLKKFHELVAITGVTPIMGVLE